MDELRSGPRVLRDREQLDSSESFPHRLLFLSEIGQRETTVDVTAGILGRLAELLFERLARHLGVAPHFCGVASYRVGLREARTPVAAVVVERARRKAQKEGGLLIVE